MNARHIRLALAYTAAGAVGYAIGSACAWITTVASLGTFLTFLLAVCAMLLAFFAGRLVADFAYNGLAGVITDARLDAAKAAVKARFAGLRAKFA